MITLDTIDTNCNTSLKQWQVFKFQLSILEPPLEQLSHLP